MGRPKGWASELTGLPVMRSPRRPVCAQPKTGAPVRVSPSAGHQSFPSHRARRRTRPACLPLALSLRSRSVELDCDKDRYCAAHDDDQEKAQKGSCHASQHCTASHAPTGKWPTSCCYRAGVVCDEHSAGSCQRGRSLLFGESGTRGWATKRAGSSPKPMLLPELRASVLLRVMAACLRAGERAVARGGLQARSSIRFRDSRRRVRVRVCRCVGYAAPRSGAMAFRSSHRRCCARRASGGSGFGLGRTRLASKPCRAARPALGALRPRRRPAASGARGWLPTP